jgi:hypothetical protein
VIDHQQRGLGLGGAGDLAELRGQGRAHLALDLGAGDQQRGDHLGRDHAAGDRLRHQHRRIAHAVLAFARLEQRHAPALDRVQPRRARALRDLELAGLGV